MATYKVPQDVEAEDKLIGPFSFRQFVYLIITVMAITLAWGLSQIFILLAVIPLPIILLFGALALPLRKDQPMEIYLAAMVSFYLKPHKRLWDPDGVESLIEITAPKTVEVQRTKDISQNEADRRFGYLAEIVDSEGWAVRGAGANDPNSSMATDIYYSAQQTQDLLDSSTGISQSFDHMISQNDEKHRQETIEKMKQSAAAAAKAAAAAPPPPKPAPQPAQPQPQTAQTDSSNGPSAFYNPYPGEIQQKVIQPVDDPNHVYKDHPEPKPEAAETSEKPVSAGIMNLANNSDLSVETIAHEANRIQKKNDEMQEEVVISLH